MMMKCFRTSPSISLILPHLVTVVLHVEITFPFCRKTQGLCIKVAIMISVLHSNTRNSEKLLEEAQYSGKLILNNRKLRDVILCSGKYDLLDVTTVDFSRNGLHEVPEDLCEWYCLKTVILSHNLIRTIPEFLVRLRLIQRLDLGNNQLTHLPPSISELRSLVVLRVNNNGIVSIPVEISQLKRCQELDISGNELNSLPPSLGEMESLLHFNCSRNNIQEIPCELCALELVYLNASENRITEVPACIHNMLTLQQFVLADNPLKNPPLKILKKGKVHLFKCLQMESQKGSKQDLGLLSTKEEVTTTHPNLDFLAQVVDKLSTTVDDGSLSSNDEKKSVQSCSSSPKKRANVLEYQISEEHLANEAVAAENPIVVDPVLPLREIPITISPPAPSPVKKVEKKDSSQEFQTLTHNRRNSKEAKMTLSSNFPGYTPPISESRGNLIKPAKRADVAPDEAQFLDVIKPRKAFINRRGPTGEDHQTFTMRRRAEKMYEEMEKLEKLRQNIEATLKMPLPQDLLPALTDGVVLCHLANHVKARSIPTIHVPSPAVPKLSMAKCRRNVDNFLDACLKLGVQQKRLCSATDILHEKGISRLADTVNDLLKLSSKLSDSDFRSPTVRIAPSSASHS